MLGEVELNRSTPEGELFLRCCGAMMRMETGPSQPSDPLPSFFHLQIETSHLLRPLHLGSLVSHSLSGSLQNIFFWEVGEPPASPPPPPAAPSNKSDLTTLPAWGLRGRWHCSRMCPRAPARWSACRWVTKNSWSLVIVSDGKNPQIQHGVTSGRIQRGFMGSRTERKKQEESKTRRVNGENKAKC